MALQLLNKNILPPITNKIAIACSGGSDSMALTLLVHEHFPDLIALTVDHGLREEAAEEASQVGKWLKKHNIEHKILKWQGEKPSSNIQETARKARYKLLTDYCKKHDIKYLLVAHTLDDQAETFMLRLIRGSGVDGLAAMSSVSNMNGITILRPLLEVKKAALIEFLVSKKQKYVNDPSNENLAYDRIKIRKLLPELEKIGLTPERLAKTADNMQRARQFLEQETQKFINSNCEVMPDGSAIIKHLPDSDEIALRVLTYFLKNIGNSEVPPRLDSLKLLYNKLQEQNFKPRTLGGCIFKLKKHGIVIMSEKKYSVSI